MKLESLEELRVFAQIVESGSLVAAARALGLPPNTVSRRLASLEARLELPLLHRTTRSQSLSEAGRTLLGRARRILDEAELAEGALRCDAEGLVGLVRVGLGSPLTRPDMLSCLAALLEAHPRLQIQVRVTDLPVNPIAAGLDVVVVGGLPNEQNLIARKLVEVRPVLAASEGYLARRGVPQRLEDLEHHDVLRFLMDPPLTSWVLYDDEGEQHVVPIEGRFETDDGRALMDGLIAGLGIGIASPRLVRATPALRRVLPRYTMTGVPLYAIYPASGQRSARLQAVVEALQRAVTAADEVALAEL
ncbi:MAG: LysR family transcriptional regulator [Myxococcales bacterium]|nr:LysR family transcriptional regulator [Myxococcales bacterium]